MDNPRLFWPMRTGLTYCVIPLIRYPPLWVSVRRTEEYGFVPTTEECFGLKVPHAVVYATYRASMTCTAPDKESFDLLSCAGIPNTNGAVGVWPKEPDAALVITHEN